MSEAAGIHGKSRPATNRLKKLQALRKQSLQKRSGHAQARRLFVERSGGSAAKAAGRRRLAPVPDEADWARLKDEEGLLNDALLDFHLDRLAVLSSCADRVHAFSSLFYSRLMEGGVKQVSRWTRSLRQKVSGGIFSKEVIFVPAHDSVTEHWFLALIVCPWAAARVSERNGERLPAPTTQKTFIAFLDSLHPRLQSSQFDAEDLQVARQAATMAEHRQERALKLLREYLKHEWLSCYSGAGTDYCEDLIPGIPLDVPQQNNTTDCGVYVLEYARRLLDNPRLLDHLCTHQTSPPQLMAPVSRSLRRRWQKLGERLVADADAPGTRRNEGRVPTPARSGALPPLVERAEDEVEEVGGVDLSRNLPMELDSLGNGSSLEESIKILDLCLPRLAMNSSTTDRVWAFESVFYQHLLRKDWSEALEMSSGLRREMAEGIFNRDLIMVPSHDENGTLFLALIVQPWAAMEVTGTGPESLGSETTFVAWLGTVKADVKCLEKFREYLKREYSECFGLASGYDVSRIHEVVLKLPKGDANPTMALLELAHRLLDPDTLDHLCSLQESPPSLLAPLELQGMKPSDLFLPE